jgi:hypothetical protein
MPRQTIGKKNSENIEVMVTKLEYIQEDVRDIKHRLEGNYVTKEAFEPVRRIVYGMISVILLSVVGALVALVVM